MEEIREIVDNDLGFHQVETKVPSQTKTFLFISNDKKVTGCLIAEHIQEVSAPTTPPPSFFFFKAQVWIFFICPVSSTGKIILKWGYIKQNIHMNATTQGFPTDHYPEHHPASCDMLSYHSAFCCHTHLLVYMMNHGGFIRLDDLLPFLYGPVLMLTCPLYAVSVANRGQHGHSDR